MSVLDRTLRNLLGESSNRQTLHLQSHLEDLDCSEKLQLLHQVLCIRPPCPLLPEATLRDIDAVLIHRREHRLITQGSSIPPIAHLDRSDAQRVNIKIWKGDITRLGSDVTAITNAANSQMLGCFRPTHKCIDNVIHSWAGPRLRQECLQVMTAKPSELLVGEAATTQGFCLSTPYIIHTVGPQLRRGSVPTDTERQQLRECYISVLEEAERLPPSSDGSKRVALCAVSTGLFAFPAAVAARIAVFTVLAWLAQHEDSSITDVIFVTYADGDYEIYTSLLKEPAPGSRLLSTGNLASAPAMKSPPLSLASRWLQETDFVILSAGAGLSAADGLDYTSTTLFQSRFPGFLKYGFTRLYDVFGFTDWPSEQDRWSYFFTHLEMIRSWPKSDLYHQLIAWLKTFGEDAHVRTSNADGLFVANGWDEQLISTPQGQYAVLQCMANCRPDSYWPLLPYLDRARFLMDPETQRLRDVSAIPTCKHCGGDMFICVRAASWFNESPFRAGELRWREFRKRVLTSDKKKTVILELGAGMNTPGVLRWPNEDLVRQGQGKVRLIRVGMGHHSTVPDDLEEEGLATYIDGDIKATLSAILPRRTHLDSD